MMQACNPRYEGCWNRKIVNSRANPNNLARSCFRIKIPLQTQFSGKGLAEPGRVAWVCDPSVPMGRWRKSPQKIKNQLACSMQLGTTEEKSYPNQGGRWGPKPRTVFWPPHAPHNKHMYTQTWTHKAFLFSIRKRLLALHRKKQEPER